MRYALVAFRERPRLYWNVLITIPIAFAQAMTLAVLVIVARRTLGLGPFGTGLFLAGIECGNVVGGLVAGRCMARVRHTTLLLGAFALSGTTYLAVYGQRNAILVSALSSSKVRPSSSVRSVAPRCASRSFPVRCAAACQRSREGSCSSPSRWAPSWAALLPTAR